MLGALRTSVCGVLLTLSTIAAPADTLTNSSPIIGAVQRGDCNKALKALMADGNGSDTAYALFVAGRFLDEGICLRKDPSKAAAFFERSAALGDVDAQLDYAAKIGLGEGRPQDYVSAGFECHKAGVDPSGLLPFYSLGYSCTVRAVAGRLLRMSLPAGAFEPPIQAAQVEFNPLTSELHILSTPAAAKRSGWIDSHRRSVDASQAIQKAWHEAVGEVPKPDTKNLTSDLVQLSLDMDGTLEIARNSQSTLNGPMPLPADLMNRSPGPNGMGMGMMH